MAEINTMVKNNDLIISLMSIIFPFGFFRLKREKRQTEAGKKGVRDLEGRKQGRN
jgi:hypothetical protein